MQFCFTQSCHKVCPSEERGISTSNSIQFYFVQSCHTVCPSEERGISARNSMQFCYPLAEMKNYCWRKLSWRFLLRRKDKQCEERRIFGVVIWKETSAYTVNLNPIPCKFSIEIPSSFTKILRSREIKTSRLRPIK